MDLIKSLEIIDLFTAMLHDVQRRHESVFGVRALHLTVKKAVERTRSEGEGFLTKTLPHLGKAFDRVLASDTLALNPTELGFKPIPGTKVPLFLGELFANVLGTDGKVLREPHIPTIRTIRQVLYLFYKYELPYSLEQEQHVTSEFERTEDELSSVCSRLCALHNDCMQAPYSGRRPHGRLSELELVQEARRLLSGVFSYFDYRDVYPRHGPGAVATKQRLWAKYQWTNVSRRITEHYPLDEYFYSCLGHVCDSYRGMEHITEEDLSARVCLVPKDSRGPRLISCEPVDFQWIQQGLGRAIMDHVENIDLTRGNIFFTNQQPNQLAARIGSIDGKYATLDLKEASDRITVELVKLLYPEHISNVLLGCRSLSTTLPSGKEIRLKKFAPMGSALCFPILALTIWAVLTAAAPDQDTRERILVYGDDVIVPIGFAEDAIERLELVGLRVNRDKSCTRGFFRESCGTDAYKGVEVTPVRLRTVWSSHPTASAYTSWIAYANSLYDTQYFSAYDYIVGRLSAVYGAIPCDDMLPFNGAYPTLREATSLTKTIRSRTWKRFQRKSYLVRVVRPKLIKKHINGWSKLLRYFTEGSKTSRDCLDELGYLKKRYLACCEDYMFSQQFDASTYTPRDSSMLEFRWR